MKIIQACQRDTLIYWAYIGADRYGQPQYAAPIQLRCRWDDAVKQVFTDEGSPVFSKIELITQIRLKPKDLVKKGRVNGSLNLDDPKANPDTHEVIMSSETPMIRNRSVYLYEAYA
jgi:hypothetical protein